MTLPSADNLLNTGSLDLWKLFIERSLRGVVHNASDSPQPELGQKACEKWLGEELIQVRVGRKLCDLATSELLHGVISDVELVAYSRRLVGLLLQ